MKCVLMIFVVLCVLVTLATSAPGEGYGGKRIYEKEKYIKKVYDGKDYDKKRNDEDDYDRKRYDEKDNYKKEYYEKEYYENGDSYAKGKKGGRAVAGSKDSVIVQGGDNLEIDIEAKDDYDRR